MDTLEPVLLDGEWRPSQASGHFRAENPATGEAFGPLYPVSDAADIEQALRSACQAAPALAAASPEHIATFLEAYAVLIDRHAEELARMAQDETGLPADTRIAGNELPRTTDQLRQAAQAVRRYAWSQPVIDTVKGLRAHFAPLGKPVLIMGPNNFPLAFNAVSGSDFASAIAARNPVIAKGHPSHPGTSKRLAELAREALRRSDLPVASVQMLYKFDSSLGLSLAGDSRLGAIAFTGSRAGGLALKAAADKAGIPIYAEMSSINPVFLLPGAIAERGADKLAAEFFASCTAGTGQFCTNPGLVIVPRGEAGDAFVSAATEHFAQASPGIVFSRGVRDNFLQALQHLGAAGAKILAGGQAVDGPGHRVAPTLLSVGAGTFLAHGQDLQHEAFGPASLLVRANDVDTMCRIAARFEGNLTGTLYRANDGHDDATWKQVVAVLRPRVGRLISNKMPTGVAVSPAMNHGGPYPSTTHPGHTAVGMPAAIRRFAALHCYDNVPQSLLPTELRDHNPGGIPRLVDGLWTRADLMKKSGVTA
ncbi:MAG TPA: aldehyde dehydrogenase family protein [Rhodanobacteraceae bacterium]